MKSNEKITIGWIDGGLVTSGFVAHLSQILLHRSDIIENVVVGCGPYLSLNRNSIARSFLDDTNSNWLLSLDSDLMIDLKSFDALIDSADSDKYDVIGGKYYVPVNDGVYVSAQKKHPEIEGGGAWIQSDDPDLNKKMIENLHSVGAGFMLIHRRVLEKILKNSSNQFPWFRDYWTDYPYETWISDDIHFCDLANRHGFNIALCTNATSSHLKTSKIDDSIYLNFNNFNKWIKEKNYRPEVKKNWWVRNKK